MFVRWSANTSTDGVRAATGGLGRFLTASGHRLPAGNDSSSGNHSGGSHVRTMTGGRHAPLPATRPKEVTA